MIIDNIENLEKYALINPLFLKVVDFIKNNNLNAYEIGKSKLQDDQLIVNFALARPKTKEEAKLETHNKYIDIQIPLTGPELMGYTPRKYLPIEEYNNEKDITFYKGLAESYIDIKPGMFAIFFPEDGHAPAITSQEIKKVIFKVIV